jgi:hypothetical protein
MSGHCIIVAAIEEKSKSSVQLFAGAVKEDIP